MAGQTIDQIMVAVVEFFVEVLSDFSFDFISEHQSLHHGVIARGDSLPLTSAREGAKEAMLYFLSVLIDPYRHQGGVKPFRVTNLNKTIHYSGVLSMFVRWGGFTAVLFYIKRNRHETTVSWRVKFDIQRLASANLHGFP